MTDLDAPTAAAPERRRRRAARDHGGVGERLRAWRPTTDLAVGTIAGVAIFALLMARNTWILQGHLLFGGDEGNQFGTAWNAITLRELRGNGSRTGFHHPGPSYLYVWGAADVMRKLLGSPIGQHNAMMIGGLALNAAQLGAVFAIVRSHLDSVVRATLVLCAFAALASVEPHIMAGPWLPHMFFASFTLLVVAAASVAAGRLPSLVAFAAAAGFLLQGHVAFASFVIVITLAMAVVMWRTGNLRALWRDERRTMWAAGGVLALFVIPVAGSTLANWPGEFEQYLEWAGRDDTGGFTMRQTATFLLHFWPGGGARAQLAVAALTLGALAGVSWWRRSRFGACLLVAALLMELCLAYYVRTGLDDINAFYVALWMVALPGLTAGTAVALALPDRIVAPSDRAARVAVAAVAAIVVLATTFLSASTRFEAFRLDAALAVVDEMEAGANGRPIVLDGAVEVLGSFYLAPAILSEAEDRNLDICLAQPGWTIKYDSGRICTAQERLDGDVWTIYPFESGLPPSLAGSPPPGYVTGWIDHAPRRSS